MSEGFPRDEFEGRARNVLAAAASESLDALLLVGLFPEKEGHVCYLTNHRNWIPQWPKGSGFSGVGYSFCILTSDGDAHLIAGAFDEKALAPIVRRLSRTMDAYTSVLDRLVDVFGGGPGRLGVAGLDILPGALGQSIADRLPRLDIIDAENILWRARLIKSKAEQALLGDMGSVSNRAIAAAIANTEAGRTNAEIAAHCVAEALTAGADHVLRCRLRSGRETAQVRWPYASQRKVTAGEFVQVDLVGVYRNYVFDVSRVWTVGSANAEQVDAIQLASEITTFLTRELRPGRVIGDVAADMIETFSGRIPEARVICEGHSCGIDCVEFPWVFTGVDEVVREGMFLNVEPHIKVDGEYTLKIEDQFIVGSEANHVINVISHHPETKEASQ